MGAANDTLGNFLNGYQEGLRALARVAMDARFATEEQRSAYEAGLREGLLTAIKNATKARPITVSRAPDGAPLYFVPAPKLPAPAPAPASFETVPAAAPRPLAKLTEEKKWCSQCDARVARAQAERCGSAFCDAKKAFT